MSNSGHRRLAAAVIGSTLLLTACGRGIGPAAPPTVPSSSSEGEAVEVPVLKGANIDWMHPEASVQVGRIEEARGLLAFTPFTPAIGAPRAIFVGDPESLPLEARGVVYVFLEASRDPFWVVQEVAQVTQESLERLASEGCPPPMVCAATRSIVLIRGGTRALLTAAEPQPRFVTSVSWLDKRVYVAVMGPADTFTPSEALAVANAL
jgi:hypothetical protein